MTWEVNLTPFWHTEKDCRIERSNDAERNGG
jgi:hypothetical protein